MTTCLAILRSKWSQRHRIQESLKYSVFSIFECIHSDCSVSCNYSKPAPLKKQNIFNIIFQTYIRNHHDHFLIQTLNVILKEPSLRPQPDVRRWVAPSTWRRPWSCSTAHWPSTALSLSRISPVELAVILPTIETMTIYQTHLNVRGLFTLSLTRLFKLSRNISNLIYLTLLL